MSELLDKEDAATKSCVDNVVFEVNAIIIDNNTINIPHISVPNRGTELLPYILLRYRRYLLSWSPMVDDLFADTDMSLLVLSTITTQSNKIINHVFLITSITYIH